VGPSRGLLSSRRWLCGALRVGWQLIAHAGHVCPSPRPREDRSMARRPPAYHVLLGVASSPVSYDRAYCTDEPEAREAHGQVR
jgi:hypothetical protein